MWSEARSLGDRKKMLIRDIIVIKIVEFDEGGSVLNDKKKRQNDDEFRWMWHSILILIFSTSCAYALFCIAIQT